ncbi:CaiB/BaiF CoA-transferase family protein [Rhodoligotrophos ferricapiens]|uniref:CaiB/BaiF CoA-transferase family protein n=1 Tax=Rhodoligotrophos ferricapiens TaxID=3069264 RepID=UPI00315CE053
MDNTALADLVVLEIGDRRACAACGLLFAQAGAEVIVVEPDNAPQRDKWRSRATLFAGKRSLLWRGGGEDDELLARALAAADIVLLSSDIDSAAGRMVRARLREGQIVCDITAFGPDAPSDHRGWSEKLMQAITGVADVTGLPELPPTASDVAALEFHAGLYAAAGVLAALRVRRRNGPAQRVDVSLYACGINALATYLPLHYGGKATKRAGNRHPMAAPWNAYKARDGWVLLCSAKDEHWVKLCDLMGRPELAREGPLVKLADRITRVDEVDAAVNQWMDAISVEDSVERLNKGDIASGPILEIAKLEQDENIAHRRMAVRLHDPVSGKDALVAGAPLKASRTPGRSPTAIPAPDGDRDFIEALTPRRHLSPMAAPDLPCAGLRVIEIGQYTTAPLAARQLASLGAEVIKIEPPTGEASRAWPPHQAGTGYFFAMSNSGKRSVALDLRASEDREIFRRLIESADVLVENMKPGSLTRLGFAPDELERINPRLVYCGISGFGASSVHPGRPAFDTVVQAMSGIMDLTRVQGVPTKLGVSAGDITGGLFALFAILALLDYRDRTGLGQSIDLAMQDAAVWMTQTNWNGERSEPLEMVAGADGYVAIAASADDVAAAVAKVENAPALSRDALASALRAQGVPAAPVRSVAEVADDPETFAAGIIAWREADGLRWPLLGPPFQLSQTPAGVGAPIGPLGEGNREVAVIGAQGAALAQPNAAIA